ncbi:hypothetical protein [Dietzia sp. Alg238-R159]|uniref:hypothetical protein n=1 Tax=Dietzia sp. Alg238-R159 TaxID=2305986 RepID=UPI0013D867B5|nr:hypothetical protein [Dietzia sp. Alg238-R159]
MPHRLRFPAGVTGSMVEALSTSPMAAICDGPAVLISPRVAQLRPHFPEPLRQGEPGRRDEPLKYVEVATENLTSPHRFGRGGRPCQLPAHRDAGGLLDYIGGHDARLEVLELLEDPENMISDIEVATGWEAV